MDEDAILVSAGGRPGHFPEHSNEANPAGRGPSLAKIPLRPSRGSSQGLVGAIPSCGLAGCVPLAHLEDVRSVEGCCPLVAVRLDFFAAVLDGLSGHHCCLVQALFHACVTLLYRFLYSKQPKFFFGGGGQNFGAITLVLNSLKVFKHCMFLDYSINCKQFDVLKNLSVEVLAHFR